MHVSMWLSVSRVCSTRDRIKYLPCVDARMQPVVNRYADFCKCSLDRYFYKGFVMMVMCLLQDVFVLPPLIILPATGGSVVVIKSANPLEPLEVEIVICFLPGKLELMKSTRQGCSVHRSSQMLS